MFLPSLLALVAGTGSHSRSNSNLSVGIAYPASSRLSSRPKRNDSPHPHLRIARLREPTGASLLDRKEHESDGVLRIYIASKKRGVRFPFLPSHKRTTTNLPRSRPAPSRQFPSHDIQGRMWIYRTDIRRAETSSTRRTLSGSYIQSRLNALFAEQVSASIDDDAFEPQVAV